MKTRIISLFLSALFLSILTFEYISNIAVVENSSSKTIECVFEKRVADKFFDDTYLLSPTILTFHNPLQCLHTFDEIIYSFKPLNTLFRPPIHNA